MDNFSDLRCVIHGRIAEFQTHEDGRYWCDKCMDEIINPDGYWLYLTPEGEYWLAGQEQPEWGDAILKRVGIKEARTKQLELQNSLR